MYPEKEKLILKNILNAIYQKKVMKLVYYAAVKENEKERLVEPYSITETRRGTMVRLFQVAPVPGWRLFNLKLILSAEETEQLFTPRRPTAEPADGATHLFPPVQEENQEQAEYQRLVLEVIADMQVTDEEMKSLVAARQRLGLSDDEVRGVLYKVLADFLETMTADGLVTHDEMALLKELNTCLHRIGEGRI